MAENSKIEWCSHTFNHVWGCTKVSPGCNNCYAENMANRFSVKFGVDEPRRTFGDKHWNEPLKWNRRAAEQGVRERVFCASMADVFDKNSPEGVRERLWALIKSTPNLDWLIVTKRIGNAKNMLPADWGDGYPNAWLMITVVNQEEADRDIPKLLDTPAVIRGLSMEPLLGKVNLHDFLPFSVMHGVTIEGHAHRIFGGVDWVIVGGESGPNARPIHPDWIKLLRDQCKEAGVPFFFKQWGEWYPNQIVAGGDLGGDMRKGLVTQICFNRENDGHFCKGDMHMRKVGKKEAGRLLDGKTYDEYPVAIHTA